mgnify:CR=1 FL=1
MDKLFVSIVLITALIAGYIVYDTSKDVGIEMDRQMQTAGAIWNKATATPVVVESSDTEKPAQTQGETLKKTPNGNYVITQVNGKRVGDDSKYTLLITDTKISGRICNSFSGSYSLSGNIIVSGPLASTKMACIGEAGDYENIFFLAITSKPAFQDQNDQMTLTGGGNILVFKHIYE